VTIRAVLDTSAIRAYDAGSLAVGELIGEFSDEGVQFGLPALCLIEAAAKADDQTLAMLDILTRHADAVGLPLDLDDWRQLAAAAELLGSIAHASAALPVAYGDAGYVITAEPEAYPGLDTIAI